MVLLYMYFRKFCTFLCWFSHVLFSRRSPPLVTTCPSQSQQATPTVWSTITPERLWVTPTCCLWPTHPFRETACLLEWPTGPRVQETQVLSSPLHPCSLAHVFKHHIHIITYWSHSNISFSRTGSGLSRGELKKLQAFNGQINTSAFPFNSGCVFVVEVSSSGSAVTTLYSFKPFTGVSLTTHTVMALIYFI